MTLQGTRRPFAMGHALAATCALWAVLSVAAPVARAAITVTDDTGAKLTLAAPPRRIVSLAPGATEMLFAAGAGDRVVATVFGSEEPQAARKLPRIGDANALDWERLVALKPDVVIAWKDLTNRLVIESLAKINMKVYFVSARGLGDIPASVRRLGAMAGTSGAAGPAAAAMEGRIAAIASRKTGGEPLRVFYMIWDVPLYTVGSRHIISDSIGRCGGRSIFDDIDFPAPIVEFESVVKRNPELILMSTTPITARDWRERWARFPAIRAVATRQVVTFSDPRLDRMGPTAIEAVEGLCVQMDAVRAALAAADKAARAAPTSPARAPSAQK